MFFQFLKLQGKKGRREEMVNIVDVHADDQKSTVDLMKHMTEEKEMRSFSKKGKDMPSSQQRRKHQITYLAFQVRIPVGFNTDIINTCTQIEHRHDLRTVMTPFSSLGSFFASHGRHSLPTQSLDPSFPQIQLPSAYLF